MNGLVMLGAGALGLALLQASKASAARARAKAATDSETAAAKAIAARAGAAADKIVSDNKKTEAFWDAQLEQRGELLNRARTAFGEATERARNAIDRIAAAKDAVKTDELAYQNVKAAYDAAARPGDHSAQDKLTPRFTAALRKKNDSDAELVAAQKHSRKMAAELATARELVRRLEEGSP